MAPPGHCNAGDIGSEAVALLCNLARKLPRAAVRDRPWARICVWLSD